jgi:hypothetical protein
VSWSYDFGVVKSAAELRKAKPRMSMTTPRLDDDTRETVRAEAKAQLEHAAAARDAAALLIEESGITGPVAVFASGQANPDHEPIDAVVDTREVELQGGEVVEVTGNVSPAALETITITITQAPAQE